MYGTNGSSPGEVGPLAEIIRSHNNPQSYCLASSEALTHLMTLNPRTHLPIASRRVGSGKAGRPGPNQGKQLSAPG